MSRKREGREDREHERNLEKENEKLRRQVARLTRRLEKEGPPEPEIEEDDKDEKDDDGPGRRCPKCGSRNLGRFPTPRGVALGCKACKKWKEFVKK